MEIFLIDGIGPFFIEYIKTKKKVNWSKIPFHHLSKEAECCVRQFAEIADNLEIFAQKVSKVGYNGITFDDVAHLTPDKWLEPEINRTVRMYGEQYQKLFTICSRYGLDVYLTMDILSLTPKLKEQINGNFQRIREFIQRQLETVLHAYPEVRGIILRIGECDGRDVRGDFKSELVLRRAKQANSLLRAVLPIFERYQRYLILRNWTVGAYPIGDFLWHRSTISRVLEDIESPWFILSLKYGESDFFRYLPLNTSFFQLKVKKIIELQARREYEGAGEYPSFIGWDYQEYARQLEQANNMVGISVWCQTGGWLPFRRLTYLEEAGFWNELNSFVCIKLFKEKLEVEQAVASFADSTGCHDPVALLELLRLSDEVIKDLLYIKELARQKLFFRRVRIPPLLSVFWNNIFINHSVRKVLRTLVVSGENCVESGYRSLEKIEKMEVLAKKLALPADDIRYMYDTFAILALAREYYFSPYDNGIKKRISKAKKKYKKKYPKGSRPRYRVKTNFTPFAVKRSHLQWLFYLLLRRKRGYRVLDHLLTLRFLAIIFRGMVVLRPKLIPKFGRKHAMGIDTLFK